MNLNSFIVLSFEYFLSSSILLFLTISVFTVYRLFEFQSALGRSLVLTLFALFCFGISSYKSHVLFSVFSGFQFLACQFSISQDYLTLISKSVICVFSVLYVVLIIASESHRAPKQLLWFGGLIIVVVITPMCATTTSCEPTGDWVMTMWESPTRLPVAQWQRPITLVAARDRYWWEGEPFSNHFTFVGEFTYPLGLELGLSEFILEFSKSEGTALVKSWPGGIDFLPRSWPDESIAWLCEHELEFLPRHPDADLDKIPSPSPKRYMWPLAIGYACCLFVGLALWG